MARILTDEAKELLSKRPDVKKIIVKALKMKHEKTGLRSVNRWIRQNKDDNPLTLETSLLIMSKHMLIPRSRITKESKK